MSAYGKSIIKGSGRGKRKLIPSMTLLGIALPKLASSRLTAKSNGGRLMPEPLDSIRKQIDFRGDIHGQKPPLQAVMLNLTIGYWVARLVQIAAKLKLAGLLKDGPRKAAYLATATGVHAQAVDLETTEREFLSAT